jgi:hypothetical protein
MGIPFKKPKAKPWEGIVYLSSDENDYEVKVRCFGVWNRYPVNECPSEPEVEVLAWRFSDANAVWSDADLPKDLDEGLLIEKALDKYDEVCRERLEASMASYEDYCDAQLSERRDMEERENDV